MLSIACGGFAPLPIPQPATSLGVVNARRYAPARTRNSEDSFGLIRLRPASERTSTASIPSATLRHCGKHFDVVARCSHLTYCKWHRRNQESAYAWDLLHHPGTRSYWMLRATGMGTTGAGGSEPAAGAALGATEAASAPASALAVAPPRMAWAAAREGRRVRGAPPALVGAVVGALWLPAGALRDRVPAPPPPRRHPPHPAPPQRPQSRLREASPSQRCAASGAGFLPAPGCGLEVPRWEWCPSQRAGPSFSKGHTQQRAWATCQPCPRTEPLATVGQTRQVLGKWLPILRCTINA